MSGFDVKPLRAPRAPTRLRQVMEHDPANGLLGDCYRTVLACLIGATDPRHVPHFVELCSTEAGWEQDRLARHWLRRYSLDLGPMFLADCAELRVPAMATAPSHRYEGRMHAVVLCPDGTIWDPSGCDDYTADEVVGDAGWVICEPYEPDPDAMVAAWRAEDELTTEPGQ